ncbi:MAG: winged helix-turn-helix domain-containing protein [Verrucomicrobiota bacterium]
MTELPSWTFFSNHAHVMLCLVQNPEQPLREVAMAVGITERAVQRIVSDLEDAGYIQRERVGRQNHYIINQNIPMRHELEAHCTIGELLDTLVTK